ncbi:MAG: BTAD domain-containing putative transcriptional regulator, partial [Methylomonas sp.]|nr:BTAD domain-containing putative transcriptional regulator [Methylomonas sp.]
MHSDKLRLHLLGEPRFSPLAPPAYRKARALLFFLVIENRPQTRDFLAARFWPALGGEPARAKLRRMVYHINHSLDLNGVSPLLAERQQVGLHAQYPLQIDWLELRQLLKQPANRHNLHCAEQWFGGELLSGYDEEFQLLEDWLAHQRQLCREQALAVFKHLAAGLQRGGDWIGAEQAWQRCAELSPWDADIRRQLMQLQLLDGRRAEAAIGLDYYQKRLRDDLGVELDGAGKQDFLALLDNGRSDSGEQDRLHAEAATAMCEHFPESVRQRPEMLAWHLTRSGQHQTAARVWLDAARRSAERWEIALVQRYCQEARQNFLSAGTEEMLWQGEVERLEQLAATFAQPAAESHPAPPDKDGFLQRFIAWAGADAFQGQVASLPLARELVDFCLNHEHEDWQLHRAYWLLGHSAFFAGEFTESLAALNRIPIRPFDPPDPVQSLGGSQIAAITLGQSAWSLHFLGEDHAADNHAAMALALAQAGNDAPTLSLAWFFSANLRRWQRNWSQLLPEAEAMLAAAQQPTLHA